MTRNILSPKHRDVLQQFAWSNVLVVFDYDGTLAPIVPRPERALLRSTTRKGLKRLTRAYPCVVISGRAQADISVRMQDLGVHRVVGNHGAESSPRSVIERVQRWRACMRGGLDSVPGIEIEDKGVSLAIHYRRCRRKTQARAAIFDAAATLGPARIIAGKLVVNLLPPTAPHKGIALERERSRFRCDTAIYVGDDESDEDVFALDQPGRLLSIRVGPGWKSHAAYHIPDQVEVDELLRLLVELRSASSWTEEM